MEAEKEVTGQDNGKKEGESGGDHDRMAVDGDGDPISKL